MVPESDQEQIEAACAGNQAALRALLEQFGPQVGHQIRGQIGPQWQSLIDADDVMQVTYIEAFLRMPELTVRTAPGFAGWLRRIAENNLRDAIKGLQRKKRPESGRRVQAQTSEESYVALVEMLGATSATPSRHAAANEAQRIIDAALERMPPDYARVIRLYDLENRSIQDVAAALNRSPGAVHMLRARAHERLRAVLGPASHFFSTGG